MKEKNMESRPAMIQLKKLTSWQNLSTPPSALIPAGIVWLEKVNQHEKAVLENRR